MSSLLCLIPDLKFSMNTIPIVYFQNINLEFRKSTCISPFVHCVSEIVTIVDRQMYNFPKFHSSDQASNYESRS